MLFNVPHSSPHLPDHSVKLYDIKIIEFNISAEAAKLIILDRWAAARAGVTMPGISSSHFIGSHFTGSHFFPHFFPYDLKGISTCGWRAWAAMWPSPGIGKSSGCRAPVMGS